MGRAIAVKTDYSSAEVRRLAKRTKDAAQARRLLAVAATMSGKARFQNGKVSLSINGGPEVAIPVDWIANRQGEFPLFRCLDKRRHSLYVTDKIACRRCSGLDYLSREGVLPALVRPFFFQSALRGAPRTQRASICFTSSS